MKEHVPTMYTSGTEMKKSGQSTVQLCREEMKLEFLSSLCPLGCWTTALNKDLTIFLWEIKQIQDKLVIFKSFEINFYSYVFFMYLIMNKLC